MEETRTVWAAEFKVGRPTGSIAKRALLLSLAAEQEYSSRELACLRRETESIAICVCWEEGSMQL